MLASGAMCDIIKNSGKEQTFHDESVERANDTGHRFFDLIEVDIAEKTLRTAAVAGVITYAPNPAQLRSERKRERQKKEDTEFERAMKYACQIMHLLDNGKRNSNS